MDRFSKYLAISNALRNQPCDLELVSTLTLSDGTTQEIVHSRRAVCKKASRKRNVTVLEFADIDRAALDQAFPFETFTVADFPEVFVDHVGRRIAQGVGTVVKMPLTWVRKTGGWSYAGPKSTGTNQLLAVYRGTQPGQGSVVAATEYTTGLLAGAATGVVVDAVNFSREQLDFQGRPYILEADYLLSGTRTAPAEISRLLALYGITVDGTFATASAADTAAGFLIDALYGANAAGRTGKAIIEDLLRIARGYIVQTATGAWSIVQDVAKASSAQFDSAPDKIDISGYGDGDISKVVSLGYRPRVSNGEDFAGFLSRTTSGQTGEMAMKNPYVRDHVVADRLLSYWQKRLNSLRMAQASLHAVQLANGDRITITDQVAWTGAKDFLATGITRPGDKNDVVLREYDASIYGYTAGVLPADATNVYSPDYSFTLPLAPTGLTVVSQGTSSDTDGKTTAYALIRAVPPVLNWARLMVQLTDTTTNEIYQAQLRLVGANYEAVVSGLRPNRLHSIVAWAVNATNVEGVTATIANFTTANATTGLSAPTVTITQIQSFELKVELSAVADVAGQPKFRRNVLFESVGGGAYTEVKRDESRTYSRSVTHGVSYSYKARSEDANGNESADSGTVALTGAKVVDGTYIVDASINRSRTNSSTGSSSGTIGNSSTVQVGTAAYAFHIQVSTDQFNYLEARYGDVGGTTPNPAFQNLTGSNKNYSVEWRYVAA